MTDNSRFEPWDMLTHYAEAGERSELEAFVLAIGPSETFRALLRMESAQRKLVLTTLSPTEAAEMVEAQPEEDPHVYVVSPTGILIGGLDLRGLVLTRRTTPLSEILKTPRFVSVTATLDELDNLFECHQLASVAVVDEHQKLLGVVRRDDLSHALQERADADHLKSQGIVGGDEIRAMPVLTRARRRLSWLSLNIFLNIIAASVIAVYEDTLSAVIALAVFLPIVSDMCGFFLVLGLATLMLPKLTMG